MNLCAYNLEDLLLTAIKSEKDSNSVYAELAAGVKNAFLKEKLRFLAEEEAKHMGYIKGIYAEEFPGKDIDLPNKTAVPLPELAVEEGMPLSQAIEMAMAAEKAAHDFYKSFAESLPADKHPKIKITFAYFATMELGHYKLLEIERENMSKFEDYDTYWPMMHMGP